MGRMHGVRCRALEVLAVVLGAVLPVVAVASDGIRFSNLSVEDGLSQTAVQTILQDRRGFIWLGTQEGLNRFDGREFVHFFRDDSNDLTLSRNWIWVLHQDRRGNIWVGTDGGGLDRLDPDSGTFTHFRHRPGDAASIGGDVVRAIAEDAGGYLWVGTDGGSLSRVDPRDGTVVQLSELPAGASLPDERIRALERGPQGTIWIGTDGGGLFRLDPGDGKVEAVPVAGAGRIRALANAGRDLWIGTYEGGLLRLDIATGAVIRYVHDADDPRSLSGDSVRSLYMDASGALWVGTDGAGLNRFVSDAEGFRTYRHQATETSSLADDHVVELFQDRGGVIWVGTYGGASRWNPGIGTFATVARRGDAPNQLSDNYVTSLEQTADGAIWVGTYGGGLNRWDRAHDSFTHYRSDPEDPTTIGDDRVFALEADGDSLWIGTRGGGLGRMDLRSHEVRRYRPDPARSESLSADGVTTILRDHRGIVWVGTFVGGLNRLDDPDVDRFVHYRHDPGDPQSLCADQVLDLLEDAAGAIWVGTFGGGVCRLDVKSGTFTQFRHDPNDPRSLSSDRAWSLHEDAAGNLWIGTQDGGLNLWTAEDRAAGHAVFTRFGREQGLGNLAVYAAESDAEGNVWFSTNRGLGKLEPATGVIRRYDVTRGLQSNEFNHGSHGRTAAGELMFGGIAGFNIFQPGSIHINEHPPQIAFTQIARLNQPMDLRDALRQGQTLTFSHRDVLVSFEYAALDYTVPSRNTYRHRLVGFDRDWVNDGTVRRTTYTNLASGSYTFEVDAANSDGVGAVAPLELHFTVLPPPWATWWAITAYALLALAAVLLLYRSQARRVATAEQIQRTNDALRAEMAVREHQQRALISAKEQTQRYLDVAEVIILSLDQNGDIRLINQTGLRVLGYREPELIGRNFYQTLVPAADREMVRARFASVDDYAYSELPIETRHGAQRLIAWHTVSLPATEDEPGGLLISGMDLTQMRSLELQVREAQKLEALGTLARGIAHDFNNILGAVLGFTEMLRGEVAAGSKAAGYLDDLELSVDRARNLVKSILTFGRQAPREAAPTLVQALVQEALQLLRPTLPPSIQIVTRCDESAPPVMADPSELHQLVMNLATNAAQAMADEGGVLTLLVAPHEVSREQARSRPHMRIGPHVQLVVADTGPGMDEVTRSRMFEPFFTTKGPSRGTGLGLSVVHGLVTRMGGDITVDSEPGRGTRISMLLPACGEAAFPPSSKPVETAAPPRGTETVMLVDDEPTLVELGRAMLAPLGYRVVSAADGREALRQLAPPAAVDLLVTDQNMPGMSGVALARAVKDIHPNLPVILVSGAHDASIGDPAVDATLEKPVRLRELARAVRAVLDRPR